MQGFVLKTVDITRRTFLVEPLWVLLTEIQGLTLSNQNTTERNNDPEISCSVSFTTLKMKWTNCLDF